MVLTKCGTLNKICNNKNRSTNQRLVKFNWLESLMQTLLVQY